MYQALAPSTVRADPWRHLINHFRFPVVVYVGVAQCVLALLFWGAGRLRRPRSVPGTDGCPRRRFVIHGVWLLLSRALCPGPRAPPPARPFGSPPAAIFSPGGN